MSPTLSQPSLPGNPGFPEALPRHYREAGLPLRSCKVPLQTPSPGTSAPRPHQPPLEQRVQRPWGHGLQVTRRIYFLVGRVPGIRSSPALRTQPLWLLVSFHKGPHKVAFHIPGRPSKSQWIKLKQQRFTWALRQAVWIGCLGGRAGEDRGRKVCCPAQSQEGGLRAGMGFPRCQSITYSEGQSRGVISPLLM